MAIFTAIRNQKQTAGAMKGAILYIVDFRKTIYNGDDLVSALHCTVYTSYVEMMMTKRQFRKEGGRQFPDFEVLVATYCNTENLHNHFIVNAVSFKDGKKCRDDKLHDDIYLKENMEKLFEFRAASGFIPLSPEPEQGWLAEAEEHLSAWITLGYHVESMVEPVRTETRIAHSERRQRRKETMKKLLQGQKIGTEQRHSWE